ncbi:MAG: hypothetical protein HAW67_04445 [Endozoicomonadaceae bacterium]|nr:hypothetical protein [Endozoicomonadaceae bacterium]
MIRIKQSAACYASNPLTLEQGASMQVDYIASQDEFKKRRVLLHIIAASVFSLIAFYLIMNDFITTATIGLSWDNALSDFPIVAATFTAVLIVDLLDLLIRWSIVQYARKKRESYV